MSDEKWWGGGGQIKRLMERGKVKDREERIYNRLEEEMMKFKGEEYM